MSKIAHCDEFLFTSILFIPRSSRPRTVYVTFDPKEKLIFSMMYVKYPNFAHYKIVSNTVVNPKKNGENSFLFPLQDINTCIRCGQNILPEPKILQYSEIIWQLLKKWINSNPYLKLF